VWGRRRADWIWGRNPQEVCKRRDQTKVRKGQMVAMVSVVWTRTLRKTFGGTGTGGR